jgi:hypothetical protein
VRRSVKKKLTGAMSAQNERKNEVGPKKGDEGRHHLVGAAVGVAVLPLPLHPLDRDPIPHLLDPILRHPGVPPLQLHLQAVLLDLLQGDPEATVDQETTVGEATERELGFVVGGPVQSAPTRGAVVVATTEKARKNDP